MDESEIASAKFGEVSPAVAARLVRAAADVAVVVDGHGMVRDVSFGGDSQLGEVLEPWRGRPWDEVVSIDSRVKAQELIREAAAGPITRARELNHPSLVSADSIPISYTAVRDTGADSIFIVGRDLRAVSALEQRLSATQQAIEQEYARLRAADTRYRLLFHLTPHPVIIADSVNRRIVEANPAAVAMMGGNGRILGRGLLQFFDSPSATAFAGALTQATTSGEAVAARLRTLETGLEFTATLSLFRQEGAAFILARLEPYGEPKSSTSTTLVPDVIDRMPDGLVVTDHHGVILEANATYLELAQLATIEQIRGQSLDRWLGRGNVDFSTLLSMLVEYGSVRGFATVVRGIYGTMTEVEVSAVAVNSPVPCLGFVLRTVARPRERENLLRANMPRSVEQLTQLVGRVPLKELVRETTDIIERLCIEAALSMTGDNRASAAEMLGLSRQSLYAKLHRFGLGDLSGGEG
ncbi:MAG: transcriptional regulator PpsR [Labrys sp. (in: a-proteobacteria)]